MQEPLRQTVAPDELLGLLIPLRRQDEPLRPLPRKPVLDEARGLPDQLRRDP